MTELKKGEENRIARFFADCPTYMPQAYLQGHMGRGWTDNLDASSCGQIILGDICFYGGEEHAPGAVELVRNLPPNHPGGELFVVPLSPGWESLIKRVYGKASTPTTRYALKHSENRFDQQQLRNYVDKLPQQYSLERIDGTLYEKARSSAAFRDLVSQFSSQEDYAARGLGFCILRDGEIVCGASSYTIYDKGIEIEIDTLPDCRRQGLATICGARLILECLDRGLHPGWDAANPESLALAQKLGYIFQGEYATYIVSISAMADSSI